MKVVNILPFNLYKPNINRSNTITNTYLLNKNAPTDVFEISFTSDDSINEDEKTIPSLDLEPALHKTNIHCPICGIKTLTQEQYENLVEQAKEVQTTKEFLEFLKNNEEHIPRQMQKILKGFNNPEITDLPLGAFVCKKKYIAEQRHLGHINITKKLLKDYETNVLPENREIFNQTLEEISANEKISDTFRKYVQILKLIDIDNDKKYELSAQIFPFVRKSAEYKYLFNNLTAITNFDSGELSKILVSRIFLSAISTKTQMDKMNPEKGNNDIILCQECAKVASNKTNFYPQYPTSIPDIKENAKKYLSDIAYLMGDGTLERNPKYLKRVNQHLNKFSKREVRFEDAEMLRFYHFMNSISRHEKFEPLNQTEVDIPCAQCGCTMLPYETHQKIIKDMKKCSTPKDFLPLFVKYYKYISPIARQTVNTYIEILNEHPHIKNEALVNKIQEKMHEYTTCKINNILDNLHEEALKLGKDRVSTYSKNSLLIEKRIRKYMKDGKFDNFQYLEMFNNCLNDIPLERCPNIVYNTLADIKRACFENSISQIEENSKLSDKNSLYTIIYNVFNASRATADHLVAHARGGDGDKNNLIGLCKPCNSIKSKKSTSSWIAQNPNIKENITKQLQIIDNMAREKKLEGYDGWALKMAQTLAKLTNYKLDIIDEFY